jgi:inhibitor of cysteine peptidase
MKKLCLTLLVISSLLVACKTNSSSSPETKKLTEKDSGGSVSLHVNDTLEITLDGNQTTGFKWDVDSGNITILRPISDPIYEPSGNAPGSGGKTIFQFKAIASGNMRLKLIYYRPFEKDIPPAQTFVIDIAVIK